MSLELRFRPAVRLDIEDAYYWYEDKQSGLGERFLSMVRESTDRILENPEVYVEIDPAIRRAPVRRFPFWVLYTIESSYLTVLAIVDSRQDPEYIKLRFES